MKDKEILEIISCRKKILELKAMLHHERKQMVKNQLQELSIEYRYALEIKEDIDKLQKTIRGDIYE